MSTADFYDRLAPLYDLVYEDWGASVDRQGGALDGIIRETWGPGARVVLDATAGIGTQALGLAARGYRVAASDLSPGAVARLAREASARGLAIPALAADVRRLPVRDVSADVVLACDNALPHLLSDDEILAALRECLRCARVGGGCLVSLRDYDAAPRGGAELKPYGVRQRDGRRYVVFQHWEWRDAERYDVALYLVEDAGGAECVTHVMRSTYYAIPVDRMAELMTRAGFGAVRRLDGRFFQPVVVGTRER